MNRQRDNMHLLTNLRNIIFTTLVGIAVKNLICHYDQVFLIKIIYVKVERESNERIIHKNNTRIAGRYINLLSFNILSVEVFEEESCLDNIELCDI